MNTADICLSSSQLTGGDFARYGATIFQENVTLHCSFPRLTPAPSLPSLPSLPALLVPPLPYTVDNIIELLATTLLLTESPLYVGILKFIHSVNFPVTDTSLQRAENSIGVWAIEKVQLSEINLNYSYFSSPVSFWSFLPIYFVDKV